MRSGDACGRDWKDGNRNSRSSSMTDGEVRYARDGEIATVIFDRPAARNAMTWRMYGQLGEACARIREEDGLRVAVFRGAGGKAFIAGTDIAQFRAFRGGDDGIDYEEKMEGILGGIEALPVPTLAVIEGFAIGGGLAIAAACDLRIATPGSRFGVPIARTLANCLSIANYARLVAALGASRAKRMLLLAENLSAEEALAAGFLAEIVEAGNLDRRVGELCSRLAQHAPITMRVSKEAIGRLLHAGLPDGDDLVRACYGSDDFRLGVEAFVDKREPRWTGKGAVRRALAIEGSAYVDWKSEALKWASLDRPVACGRARGTTPSRHRDLGGYDRLASSFLVDRPAHLHLARPRRRSLGARFHARRSAPGACALRRQGDGAGAGPASGRRRDRGVPRSLQKGRFRSRGRRLAAACRSRRHLARARAAALARQACRRAPPHQ